ncbi:hypothetical protein [Wenzhouxiangella limi]|uniref:Uncharacterized protein n=1 Tax=Wenzhouxiangella limi TaxID=2707351 RepID=A0A845V2Q1_9GAMM|nr:hypothetical protein [Wenzhouxiangella limi]NDY96984.1 hypothetical protein [Wenzhouxiangella limi]
MSANHDLWAEIYATLPEIEPDDLRSSIQLRLDCYEDGRLFSRDTAPTHRQLLAWLQQLRGDLGAVCAKLQQDESAFLITGLSAELDPTSDDPAKFAAQTIELFEATERAIRNVEQGSHLGINGVVHTQRTQTDTRDQYLIPSLIQIAMDAGLDPSSNDLEDLDRTCEFVKLVLEQAGIKAPSIGKDVERRGEAAQGRLRRTVKEAAQRLTKQGLESTR